MSSMFQGSLSNISQWNTSNVTNMSLMFHGCRTLISLPDISKWNTSKVTDKAIYLRNVDL